MYWLRLPSCMALGPHHLKCNQGNFTKALCVATPNTLSIIKKFWLTTWFNTFTAVLFLLLTNSNSNSPTVKQWTFPTEKCISLVKSHGELPWCTVSGSDPSQEGRRSHSMWGWGLYKPLCFCRMFSRPIWISHKGRWYLEMIYNIL